MNTKTYKGKTAKQALALIGREIGPDADIITCNYVKDDSGKVCVEITVVVPGDESKRKHKRTGKRRFLFTIFGFVAAVSVIAMLMFFPWQDYAVKPEDESSVKSKTNAPVIPSIAVLPFIDLSPESDQAWFCDGISEEIIYKLAMLKDLKVIDRHSAFFFRDKDADISEIGKKLGVKAVLIGSVRRSGDKFRIIAQLISVSNLSDIWTHSFNSEQHDIFAIQEEIAFAVADSLKMELNLNEQTRLKKSSETAPEVYELYLQGRFFINPISFDRLEKAIGLFNRVNEKDPSFAPAYAMKAFCYFWLSYQHTHFYPLGPTYQKAISAVNRALELDNDLAEGHFALAAIRELYEWDWPGAERSYRRALELAPERGDIHTFYGRFLRTLGEFERAIEELGKATELDPLSFNTRQIFGYTYLGAGEAESAISQYNKALELYPKAMITPAHLAICYAGLGQEQEAVAWLDKFESIINSPVTKLYFKSTVYTVLERYEESRKLLDQLFELPGSEYFSPGLIAIIYARLGDHDVAIEWLEKAFEVQDPIMIGELNSTVFWGELPSDPRFSALLKRAGFKD